MSTIHPWERRIYIDTEFTDIAAPHLISIAMVSEDGHEFYGEVEEFDKESCSAFVRAHVLPQLGKYPECTMTRDALAEAARDWMSKFSGSRQRPVICYDHPIDPQLLWELIGRKPVGWKEKLIHLRIDPVRREQYFSEHGGRHHALHDARANRVAIL